MALQVLRRLSGRNSEVTQAHEPTMGMSVLTRLGSWRVTSEPASKKVAPKISAPGEGREDSPRKKEFSASAPPTATARSAGARKSSHVDLAARAGISDDRTMAQASRMLGVGWSQYFLAIMPFSRLA